MEILYFIYVEYYKQGIWEDMEIIQDPELKIRAASLPNLIRNRWADSTNKKYEQGWRKWEAWCACYPESSSLPADPFYIALYLNDLVLDDCKKGALEAAASGIRYGHLNAGLENPMENKFVGAVLEGAKRTVGKSTVHRQKEPITTGMIKKIIDTYKTPGNLMHHRFVVTCLLGFTGFLRISELLEIRVGDMEFEQTWLKITIPKSKNDQVREGHILFISRSSSPYCTVGWVERYLKDTKLDSAPENFIICRLAKTKKGHNAIGNRPISYTTVYEYFQEFIVPVCEEISPGSYGIHSLRSGGASAAINNGVSERLVGKHGRWKSGYSRDRYLKDDKKARLSVTEAINL